MQLCILIQNHFLLSIQNKITTSPKLTEKTTHSVYIERLDMNAYIH